MGGSLESDRSEVVSRPDPRGGTAHVTAALTSAAGLFALFALGDRITHPLARACALLGVLAASAGPAILVLRLVAPRAAAIRARHLVAGASAAWLCVELAGFARRVGIPADSWHFRVVWAPLVEELAKALLFSVLATARDRDADRGAIATAGVAVGIGFAFRENVAYFSAALDGAALSLPWLVLRAFPPVFAHAMFGATYGTILAQAAIHARAEGVEPSRFSSVALTFAALAHGVYNGIPWVVLNVAPHVTVPFAVVWSLVALIATASLVARVRAATREDPNLAERVSLPEARVEQALAVRDEDRQRRALWVFTLAALGLWGIPLAIVRYLAVVFTPLAVGALLALGAARVLGVPRVLPWVALGLTVRPFFAVGEGVLGALRVWHGGALGGWLAGVSGALLWIAWALWLGARVGRAHGAPSASLAALASLAGMIGASLGANLANGRGFAPAIAMLATLLAILPRTLLLSGAFGAWAARGAGYVRTVPLALGAGVFVAWSDRLIARWRWTGAGAIAVLCAALAAWLLVRGRVGRAGAQGVGGLERSAQQRVGEPLGGDQSERSGGERE
jgi:hypothetical protein